MSDKKLERMTNATFKKLINHKTIKEWALILSSNPTSKAKHDWGHMTYDANFCAEFIPLLRTSLHKYIQKELVKHKSLKALGDAWKMKVTAVIDVLELAQYDYREYLIIECVRIGSLNKAARFHGLAVKSYSQYAHL